MGHARALLATDAATQILLANEVIAKRLSVRETEKLVARTLREAEEKPVRSEEHTSELQSLMRISYAVFCLKKKTTRIIHKRYEQSTKKKKKQIPTNTTK